MNNTRNDPKYAAQYKSNVEEAKTILNYNRKRLYKIPKRYKALNAVLDEEIKQELLNIISYWLKHDCISYGKYDMVYFLSTHNGTYKVRKKTTKGVTNKRLNFLCALGLLQKLEQKITYAPNRRFLRKGSLSDVNRNLLRYKEQLEPINTFKVFKYTNEVFDSCNKRAEQLRKADIMYSNISYVRLFLNGLENIASEVYLRDRSLSVAKKQREYEELISCMDCLIQQKGYTTKQELFDNCQIENAEIDKLFSLFKKQLWDKRDYKLPTKKQKQKFNLESDNWIITFKTSPL